ncbi:unnamed protein product [Fraxinus pennsylvanica]|uniref:Uncharacterized protein n=1 Tax=Fraxinus pennsylvanica TaxID=56036 RepID=A0AAD1ZB51_9LAMI|nr:unnamed protein product [Fraxinus pennsylvanica]
MGGGRIAAGADNSLNWQSRRCYDPNTAVGRAPISTGAAAGWAGMGCSPAAQAPFDCGEGVEEAFGHKSLGCKLKKRGNAGSNANDRVLPVRVTALQHANIQPTHSGLSNSADKGTSLQMGLAGDHQFSPTFSPSKVASPPQWWNIPLMIPHLNLSTPPTRSTIFATSSSFICVLYFPPLTKTRDTPHTAAAAMAEPQSFTHEDKILAKNSSQQEEDSHTQDNPVLSFVSNILQLFKPPAAKKSGIVINNVSESDPSKIGASVNETVVEDENKPTVVKFPRQTLAPLKLEAEAEGGEQNTNPVILWQVYAIGGFFILQWAWKRWNERKGDKKSSDEPPPAHD